MSRSSDTRAALRKVGLDLRQRLDLDLLQFSRSYDSPYPQVAIHIHEGFSGYMHEWLTSGRVDVAVMHNPVPSQNLDIHHLLNEYMCVIVPGPVAEGRKRWPYRESYAIADIGDLPLILPSRPHSL